MLFILFIAIKVVVFTVIFLTKTSTMIQTMLVKKILKKDVYCLSHISCVCLVFAVYNLNL